MSIDEHKKAGRGRPRVDTELLRARMSRADVNALNEWRELQKPVPTRSEAIRQLVKLGIAASIPRNSK